MGTIIPESRGMNVELPAPGNYQAICYKVTIIGKVPDTYNGETTLKPKIQLSWELPTKKAVFKEGEPAKPFGVHKTFNFSSNKKSDLFKFLNQWSNGEINEKTIKGFDIKNVLGQQCLLTVSHKTAKNKADITYLEVGGISSLPEGMQKVKQINPSQVFDIEKFDKDEFKKLPEWIRKLMTQSEEFKKLGLDPDEVLAEAKGESYEDSGDNQPDDAVDGGESTGFFKGGV